MGAGLSTGNAKAVEARQGQRLLMRRWLRRAIVRAAPTCTLWRYDVWADCMRFVFWPRWTATYQEIEDNR